MKIKWKIIINYITMIIIILIVSISIKASLAFIFKWCWLQFLGEISMCGFLFVENTEALGRLIAIWNALMSVYARIKNDLMNCESFYWEFSLNNSITHSKHVPTHIQSESKPLVSNWKISFFSGFHFSD